MKVQIDPRVAFCSIVAAALLAGCDDDSSKNVTPAQPAPEVECTSNTHCADRTDGKTECDMAKNKCVKPAAKPECTKKEDCAGRTDGKTDCDLSKKVCVKPQEPQANCGNGAVDAGESCDGADLGGKTCKSWSNYVDGTLVCNSMCGFDTTGCVECTEDDLSLCDSEQICSNGECVDDVVLSECGNGAIEEDEDCEDGKPINKTCADLGDFVAGDLSCDLDDCTYDISECVECTESDTSLCAEGEICDNGFCKEVQTMCGNGEIEGDEKCDGQALNGKSWICRRQFGMQRFP